MLAIFFPSGEKAIDRTSHCCRRPAEPNRAMTPDIGLRDIDCDLPFVWFVQSAKEAMAMHIPIEAKCEVIVLGM